MNKNNKNWNECAELLNVIAKDAKWDKAKLPYYEVNIEVVTERVKKTTARYGFNTPKKYDIFTDFYSTLEGHLYKKLMNHWLNGTLTDGMYMGDDNYSDFINEILAHGYDAYCEVMEDWTAAKKYVDDYRESFRYCLHFMYEHKMIENGEIIRNV